MEILNLDVELSPLNKIRVRVIREVLTGELEYCFDLDYRSDLTYEERAEGFVEYSKDVTSMSLAQLIKNYGYDYFEHMFSAEEKELLAKYGVNERDIDVELFEELTSHSDK